MKITLSSCTTVNDAEGQRLGGPGETIDVDQELGESLIRTGSAEPATLGSGQKED